ncbi:MAG: DUF2207 domain-containing protein [Bacteroidota bacterium]
MQKFFWVFSLLWVGTFAHAQGFTVQNYHVDITIHEEGYFDVVEDYDIYFQVPKHGIYRDIRTKYDLITFNGTETSRKIIVSNIEVPEHRFEIPYQFQRNLSSSLRIKIGDPNTTIQGRQHYQIRYRVDNAFLHEEDRVRFYWNLKPDGWSAAFAAIQFTVRFPESISLGKEDYFIYSGAYGTTTASKDFVLTVDEHSITGQSIEGITSYPGESVTILANLPANSVAAYVPFWPTWTRYIWIGILVLLVIAFYLVWKKYGKDDPAPATTSYYPPQGIDPAMAGFLIDDREDSVDLISLLPYWGRMGIIKIKEIPKKHLLSKGDTEITRIDRLPLGATKYEKKIFKGLFDSVQSSDEKTVLVSSLRNSFYTTMGSAKRTLKQEAQKYYVAESARVKRITVLVLLAIKIVFGLAFLFVWGILAAVCLFFTTLTLLILSTFLIKKNKVGTALLSELRGFRQFIAVSEERKLKMLMDDDPGYFESTMGYALAFGMFAKWSRKFEKLNTQPPSWYSTTGNRAYTMNHFTNSFNNAMTSTKSTMVSAPSSSSSGGGSSGGGFGGGGGGSW